MRTPTLAFVIALLSTSAMAADGLSTSSKNFVKDASIGNRFEIESSEIALSKSGDEDVKEFAHQMVTDHTKAKAELTATLKTLEATDASPNSLDAEHQSLLNKLKAADGDSFDEMYVAAQVDAHNEAVTLFKKYSLSGDNKDLNSFATKTLPTLQKHQEHINEMQSSF